MTAYTSDDVNKVFLNQEGEIRRHVLHMTSLANADTLDLTPYVEGGKVINVKAIDHAATIVGGTSGNTTTPAVDVENAWQTSYVVATDIVTFAEGPGGTSTDAYVTFDVVPNRT